MDAVVRALSEPHRRQILMLVRRQELLAGSIAETFRISRPAVSQHLSVLKEAGLIAERRDGTRRWYRARPEALTGLRLFLEELWSERLTRLKREAERDDGEAWASEERISVEREVVIAAARETVWRLLVDPFEATRWMGLDAQFDLRVGGRYEVEVLPDLVTTGVFVEIEAPRRLVHTWGWERGAVAPGSTVVAYELFEHGEQQTRLRLCHYGLPSIETAGSHSRGWAHYLPRLTAVAVGDAPGPDPWVTDPARMEDELRPASGADKTKKGTEE